MKVVTFFGAVALAASFSSAVLANQELATKSGCLACHAVDKKVIGPSYKDVAKKYAGDAGAEAKLTKIVKNGSNPAELHWKEVTGGMPMPANAHVADADVKTLVKWVLSQK
jgi:cytochrome c